MWTCGGWAVSGGGWEQVGWDQLGRCGDMNVGEVKGAPLRTPSLMLRSAPALTSDSAQDGCCE